MFKTLSSVLSTAFFFAVIVIVVLISSLWEYSSQLPDYHQLEKYQPPVTTRLFAGDGQLMMEYAAEKRLFVPVEKIPDRVKNAFIAAEDKNFYSHAGIDYTGIIRALLGNLKNIGTGRRPAGASTITQQVAKNFLLTSEVSYTRKIKEAILATRIEQAFSKNHILELYLNEIYLGNRSYGVAAAALNYFGKSLDELSIEEAAFLAALPKGPNNYNPQTRHEAALARRNWVIGRMLEDGYISGEEAEKAKDAPLETIEKRKEFVDNAQYFSEEVRRIVSRDFGDDALYEGGLIIRTTLNPKLQNIATKVFQEEIKNYDKRHGWRGAVANIELGEGYKERFEKIEMPKGADSTWQKALIVSVGDTQAEIETAAGQKGQIPLSLLSWAGRTLKNQSITEAPKSVKKVLQEGDVVFVEALNSKEALAAKVPEGSYNLRQVPDVDGGLIALDPHTGKVLAVVGGYSFQKSQFNRATQAKRQTGSAFKPIVYLAALDNGYSPNDLILDAPFVLDQGPGLPKWKPTNYSPKFYGLTTFRQGIEKSRNLMTVRLAQDLGMDKVAEYAKKTGVNDHLPHLLSMSLGAGETRVIDLAAAYAMIVNGGKKITPYFIERIQDRSGKTILKQNKQDCQECNLEVWENTEAPELADEREQVIDPLSAYQMTSIMEGVALRGTAARLRGLGKHLAGKTGTTNDNQEAWFGGFTPDLVVVTYVGFDEPRTLGRRETGAASALPIFNAFMKEALTGQPDIPFRMPSGIKLMRINYETGKPAIPGDKIVITEALKPDYSADKKQRIIGENAAPVENGEEGAAVFQTDEEDEAFQVGTEY